MKEVFILKEPLGKISEASQIFKKIKRFKIDYTQENFIVFYLNNAMQVKKTEILFKGGLDSCLIDPKTIFKNALKRNYNKLIIAHNHPSGNLNPSYEDKDIYKRLKEMGELLDLKVLDSIIFNKKEFYSLNNEN